MGIRLDIAEIYPDYALEIKQDFGLELGPFRRDDDVCERTLLFGRLQHYSKVNRLFNLSKKAIQSSDSNNRSPYLLTCYNLPEFYIHHAYSS